MNMEIQYRPDSSPMGVLNGTGRFFQQPSLPVPLVNWQTRGDLLPGQSILFSPKTSKARGGQWAGLRNMLFSGPPNFFQYISNFLKSHFHNSVLRTNRVSRELFENAGKSLETKTRQICSRSKKHGWQ